MVEDTKYPKITVVTPNFNQGKFIRQTIKSVLEQRYPNLEYIIIDGGSTDGSVDIIKKYEKYLHYWVSEPDRGMYHAINKGFEKSTGEIMCWINSDDILLKDALFIVANTFERNSHISWLQGRPTIINESGVITSTPEHIFSPYHFYLRQYAKNYSFIQQESTFWKRDIWVESGGFLSEDLALASDFDLWMRFFKISKLYCSRKQLGAFRLRKGQKSSNRSQYLNEADNSLQKHIKSLNCFKRFKILLIVYLLKVLGKIRVAIVIRLKRYLLGKLFKKYEVS